MRWMRRCVCTCLLVSPACGGDDGSGDGTGGHGSGHASGSGDDASDGASGDGDSTAAIDPTSLSFFVSSMGSGTRGGNFGGLEGADALCQELAEAAGAGARTWHAYLSTTTENARDRIGTGPWYNFAGDMVAADVESLHTDGLANGSDGEPQHVLTEYGAEVPIGEDYDILTGSTEEGTLYEERNCNDWTSDTDEFEARVGHSYPPNDADNSTSWNSAHSTNGCSEEDFLSDACRGRIYCFAID
jgi:hypothetical protein